MARARVTLEFDVPDQVPGYGSVEMAISLILADALGEFIRHRMPAKNYVTERYPWMLTRPDAETAIARKIESVEARNALAGSMAYSYLNDADAAPRVQKIEIL